MIIWIEDTFMQYPSKWESPSSNWIELPPTTRETSHKITSYVNEARNENGEVIGQEVGRANIKMDGLKWAMIDNETVSMILNLVKPKKFKADVNERNFHFNMRVPNLFDYKRSNDTFGYITLTAYSGDSDYKPYWLKKNGKNYRVGDLKVNLIDCGLLKLIGDPTNAEN